MLDTPATFPDESSEGSPLQSTGRRSTALLIDDEIDTDTAFIRYLNLDGFAVDCAPTGTGGLSRAIATRPDVIVVDLHLPDVLGLTVMSELRRANVDSAVVVVTGWYLDNHREAALAVGAAAFLYKPLDAEQLTNTLRSAISGPAHVTVARCPPAPPQTSPAPTPTSASDTDPFRALHTALVRHDDAARDALARQLLSAVVLRLQRRFPTGSPDLVEAAAVAAVDRYLRRPSLFERAPRQSVAGCVYGLARRILWNTLRSDRRRRERESEFARRVQLTSAGGGWAASRHSELVAQAIAREPDVHAQAAIRAWLDGDRSLYPWLAIPSVRALPAADQRPDIERRKDAFRSRIKRMATSAMQHRKNYLDG